MIEQTGDLFTPGFGNFLGLYQFGFNLFALGNVDVARYKAAAGNRGAANLQPTPVGPLTLDLVRLKIAGPLQAGSHLFLGVARTIFSACDVKANQVLKVNPAFGKQGGREVQQFDQLFIKGGEAQVGVAQRDAAGKVVDHGLHLVTLARELGLAAPLLGDVGVEGDKARNFTV
ncbi:hypothetical protein GALL_513110 [mine drainage metagenome]|uniref:Uncharacterized protein n=1 Tax=mine drainage metagenome TaxID=410659 RepID=A0A1J5P7D6_9ZZZZ